jgi:hypothetical protein
METVYDGLVEEIVMKLSSVRRIFLFGVLVLGFGVAGLTQQPTNQPAPAQPGNQMPAMEGNMGQMEMKMDQGPLSTSLSISFAGKSESFTPAEFAALPHVTLTAFNGHLKANQNYSGVPLIALLARLGVSQSPHGKELGLYVVAEGADGYKAVYSIGEVTPDVHDATVIVADGVDGKPLGPTGAFQLVASGEKRPARWVRNLAAIRVLPAQ